MLTILGFLTKTVLSSDKDDNEIIIKGFTPIDNDEEYAEVSDLSNNLSSMNLWNSGRVKRHTITKDYIYMLYDFIQNRKHY